MMIYDAIVIGAGLSGLTAASLLAKRGLKVAVIDKSYQPGGSCGVFKRGHVTFDQGSAMLYGFGDTGFNAHRFVFNCLEEPLDVIRHDLLYCVNFNGHRIQFHEDIDEFIDELSNVFPHEEENIRRFYNDMFRMYKHVMMEVPTYDTADETDPKTALKSMFRHPVSYLRFLSYLNISARKLLSKYFQDPEIFNFFDKLTSTYCYATLEEAPAVLAAVMFINNHVGGSYYPAGSTLFLPGKLEKVIEENNGDMFFEKEVVSILFQNGKPAGVLLDDGQQLYAPDIIYSGTVWNLYGKLIDPKYTTPRKRLWARKQEPTYPSVVLYAVVDRQVIPEGTAPIEMLVGKPDTLDESEITAYLLSIDDRTLCAEDEHTVVAIGPTFRDWVSMDKEQYLHAKESERIRLMDVLERRFPGINNAVRHAEIATPRTIERYTMKNGGAVAGPKQMLGQHMFKRLRTRTEWDNLFCCGESTVMGTGTPTVTTSGLTAANVLLKKHGLQPFVYQKNMKNYIRLLDKPVTNDKLYQSYNLLEQQLMSEALRCCFCERPSCTGLDTTDIRGLMRRIAVGNFKGAKKVYDKRAASGKELAQYEAKCIRGLKEGRAVRIQKVVAALEEMSS